MGQIVGVAAKPKRCNLNKLSQLGTPAAGEYILVSSDNSMNAAGQGNFDYYIKGDGHTAATALKLKSVVDNTLIGAFDISAYHATGDVLAKYADLSAALDGGSNIPEAFRKGGMSVKFVQSSDNKYVQYRLMATSFSTAPSDWQGVDEEPTAGSKNLVESGGITSRFQTDEAALQEMAVQLATSAPVVLTPSETYDGYKALSVNNSGKVYLNDVGIGSSYYVYVYNLSGVTSKLNITGSGNWSVAYFAFFNSSSFDAASNVGEVNQAPSGSTEKKETFYSVSIPEGAQYLLVQEIHGGSMIGAKVSLVVEPSQIISGTDVSTLLSQKFLRVDATQTFSSSEKKQGLDNLGITDTNFYLLEYYGRAAAQINLLSAGSYFYNTYDNTLCVKTAAAGASGWKTVPLKKNDLCYFLGRFYTSLDGSTLSDIGHGSFRVIGYWGNRSDAIKELALGVYFYNTYDNTLNIKTSTPGTYEANLIPLSKNDLYYYDGKLYVSLDEATLTDISTIIQNNYIVQGTGSDTGKVMSQKAVTDLFSESFTPVIAKLNDVLFDANVNAEELTGQKIEEAYFDTTGAQISNNAFNIYLFDIQSISNNLRLTSYTNWNQPLYAFYSDDELTAETLIQMGTSGTGNTELTVDNLPIPTGAKYLAVNFYRGIPSQKSHAYKLIKVIDNPINNPLRGKKWACVGDSLTAVNDRTTKHYFDYVADETGVIPLNYGYSGSGYARLRNESKAFYQRISNIDTTSDIVTIFGSFNDLGAVSQDFPLGNVSDTGTNSIAGCINTTIDNLYQIMPLCRLGIIAPTPWDTTQPSTSGIAYNYVELIKSICERRSIPFLDLWRHSNLRPWDSSFREIAYSKDGGSGTHPDENGHALIAPMFRQFILSLI